MERLIVKNFGPLKDVDIELNRINLFIGENGSGKSVLGKILTIILDVVNNAKKDRESIIQEFQDYRINYINNNTYIEYISGGIKLFVLNNHEVIQKFGEKINDMLVQHNSCFDDISCEEDELHTRYNLLEERVNNISYKKGSKKEQEVQKILKDITSVKKRETKKLEEIKFKYHKINQDILKFSPKYVPSERNLISLFSKSIASLLVADVPLPKFLLQFTSEFEKAGNEIRELNILNMRYVNGDGSNRHKIYFNKNDYIPLEQSSSGIQAVVPLYLAIKYLTRKHRDIIIEEPEQNLFPKAQTKTIQFIIEQVSEDNRLFIMTHSPYVLTTLNILMMAHRAGTLNEKAKEEVSRCFNEKQWINSDDFSAYYLENGIARNIKGRTGLISDNEIDEISDNIQSDFEELLTIYREHKNDK